MTPRARRGDEPDGYADLLRHHRPARAAGHQHGAFPGGLSARLTIAQDVYEWENGTVSLISDGTQRRAPCSAARRRAGNDVFFTHDGPARAAGCRRLRRHLRRPRRRRLPGPSYARHPACGSPETCRTGVAPTEFFPIPGSSTLIAPNVPPADLHGQRHLGPPAQALIKTGKVTLTVQRHRARQGQRPCSPRSAAADAGRCPAASHSSRGRHGSGHDPDAPPRRGRAQDPGKKHSLALKISVGYSQSTQTDVATLTLTRQAQEGNTRRKVQSSMEGHQRPPASRRVKGAVRTMSLNELRQPCIP